MFSGDHRSGGNNGALADARIVEDRRAHANQARIFNHATVNRRIVPDRDPIANLDRVLITHAVQHGAILHIAVRAQAYGMHIAAQDCVHPHAGVFAQLHLPHNLCGNVDVAGAGNDRAMTEVGPVP